MTLIEGKYWFDVSETGYAPANNCVSVTIYERRPKRFYRQEFKKLDYFYFSSESARWDTIEQRAKEQLDKFLKRGQVPPWVTATVEAYGNIKHPIQ